MRQETRKGVSRKLGFLIGLVCLSLCLGGNILLPFNKLQISAEDLDTGELSQAELTTEDLVAEYGEEISVQGNFSDELAEELVLQINNLRAQLGLNALSLEEDEAYYSLSQQRSLEFVFWPDLTPEGLDLKESELHFVGQLLDQEPAIVVQEILEEWMQDPDLSQILLNPNFTSLSLADFRPKTKLVAEYSGSSESNPDIDLPQEEAKGLFSLLAIQFFPSDLEALLEDGSVDAPSQPTPGLDPQLEHHIRLPQDFNDFYTESQELGPNEDGSLSWQLGAYILFEDDHRLYLSPAALSWQAQDLTAEAGPLAYAIDGDGILTLGTPAELLITAEFVNNRDLVLGSEAISAPGDFFPTEEPTGTSNEETSEAPTELPTETPTEEPTETTTETPTKIPNQPETESESVETTETASQETTPLLTEEVSQDPAVLATTAETEEGTVVETEQETVEETESETSLETEPEIDLEPVEEQAYLAEIHLAGQLLVDWYDELLEEINMLRVSYDLPALDYFEEGQALADYRVLESIFWQDESQSGYDFSSFELRYKQDFAIEKDNLNGQEPDADRQVRPADVMEAWQEDEGMLEILLNPEFRSISLAAFVPEGTDLPLYLASQFYPSRASEIPVPATEEEDWNLIRIAEGQAEMVIAADEIPSEAGQAKWQLKAYLEKEEGDKLYLENRDVDWKIDFADASLDQADYSIDESGLLTLYRPVVFRVTGSIATEGELEIVPLDLLAAEENFPTEAPTTVATTSEAPTTEAPTTVATKSEAPTAEATSTEEPTTIITTTEAPSTEATTSVAPTTQVTSSEAPTTLATTTAAPTEEVTSRASNTETPTAEATSEATTPPEVPTSSPTYIEASEQETYAIRRPTQSGFAAQTVAIRLPLATTVRPSLPPVTSPATTLTRPSSHTTTTEPTRTQVSTSQAPTPAPTPVPTTERTKAPATSLAEASTTGPTIPPVTATVPEVLRSTWASYVPPSGPYIPPANATVQTAEPTPTTTRVNETALPTREIIRDQKEDRSAEHIAIAAAVILSASALILVLYRILIKKGD